jgi:hypothetical protein
VAQAAAVLIAHFCEFEGQFLGSRLAHHHPCSDRIHSRLELQGDCSTGLDVALAARYAPTQTELVDGNLMINFSGANQSF